MCERSVWPSKYGWKLLREGSRLREITIRRVMCRVKCRLVQPGVFEGYEGSMRASFGNLGSSKPLEQTLIFAHGSILVLFSGLVARCLDAWLALILSSFSLRAAAFLSGCS